VVRIAAIESGSIAEELELEIGTRIVRINGQRVRDGIDLTFLLADPEIELETLSPEGESVVYEVTKGNITHYYHQKRRFSDRLFFVFPPPISLSLNSERPGSPPTEPDQEAAGHGQGQSNHQTTLRPEGTAGDQIGAALFQDQQAATRRSQTTNLQAEDIPLYPSPDGMQATNPPYSFLGQTVQRRKKAKQKQVKHCDYTHIRIAEMKQAKQEGRHANPNERSIACRRYR
jgi:hypothetical protein